MKTAILAGLCLLITPIYAMADHSKAVYVTTFHAFAKTRNPYLTSEQAIKLGTMIWEVSGNHWGRARRLAAMAAIESGNFKLSAWTPFVWPPRKSYPRYDCLGSHLNLIVQEAKKLGIAPTNTELYSDEMQIFLDKLATDPAFGTWMVAHAYTRKAKVVGLDRASHWWQTGEDIFKSKKAFKSDEYIKSICSVEASFDRLLAGAPKPVAQKKRRRK